MKNCHCNQCSFDWKARVPDPRCCPACKRYDWNQPKKGATEVANEGRSNLQPKVGKRTATDTRKRRGSLAPMLPMVGSSLFLANAPYTENPADSPRAMAGTALRIVECSPSGQHSN
jgi:hypothetical protein